MNHLRTIFICIFCAIIPLCNNGNGTFSDISAQCGNVVTMRKSSRGAVFGDYDNDGDIDILVANIGESPDLLRNDEGNKNHWLAFKSQNDMRLFFGLGNVKTAETIEIRWPNGLVQRLGKISADQYLIVTEGREEYEHYSQDTK